MNRQPLHFPLSHSLSIPPHNSLGPSHFLVWLFMLQLTRVGDLRAHHVADDTSNTVTGHCLRVNNAIKKVRRNTKKKKNETSGAAQCNKGAREGRHFSSRVSVFRIVR